MHLPGPLFRVALFLLVPAAAIACSDLWNPTATEAPRAPAQNVAPDDVRDVPAVMVHLPREVRAWDTSTVALEEELVRAYGEATVAFKSRASQRLLSQLGTDKGLRAAVPRNAIADGLALLAAHDVKVLRYNGLFGGAHVRLEPGQATELRDHPLIDYIEPSQEVFTAGSPGPGGLGTASATTPRLPASEHDGEQLEVTPVGAQTIGLDYPWPASIKNNGTRWIGIVDTDGYSSGHDDLATLPTSQCRDAGQPVQSCPGGWHGTFVGGVMTALHNGEGIRGVAKGIYDNVWFCSSTGTAEVASCITWLDSADVHVINMSFGHADKPEVANAVAQAWDGGTTSNSRLLVSITGNHFSQDPNPGVRYPGAYDEVIAVSGVMPDSTLADGHSYCTSNDSTIVEWGNASNHGPGVELAAPFYTLSTAITSPEQPEDYLYVCGTSFAAPHVAGVAALVWSNETNLSAGEVRQRLRDTAFDMGMTSLPSDSFGYGMVDANAALNPPPPPPSDSISVWIDGPSEIPTSAGEMCAWNAVVTDATGSVSYEWEWDDQLVSTQDFYVSPGATAGTHWLKVTVWDDIASDWDGLVVDVDNAYSCF